ncbi:hypothetical protein ACJRO7_001243 [Eucalyptus globulus]|uniref:HMA domain-containing protein n=1 Tax=Eucalyptus globulus TaxID=34317 RepID=A0ABD3LQA5_EUCGL
MGPKQSKFIDLVAKFHFDVDKSAHFCSVDAQADDEEPTGKPGKGNARGSSTKKNSKILGIFSKGRGGGVSKVGKVATGKEGAKDLIIDTLSKKSAVVETLNEAKAEERTQEQRRKKYDQLLSPVQPKSSHESPFNQKKNKTEIIFLLADEIKHSLKRTCLIMRASTMVLRTGLHCDGCIQKIQKCISGYRGVESVAIDASKDQVSVAGVVEMKEFVSYLKDKIKRNVVGVSTRTGVDKENKDKDASYQQYNILYAPVIFSDENPNAGSIM